MTSTNHEGLVPPPQSPEDMTVMGRVGYYDSQVRLTEVPTFDQYMEARQFVKGLPEPDAGGNYLSDEGSLDKDLINRLKFNLSPDRWRIDDDEMSDIDNLDRVDNPTDPEFPVDLVDDFQTYMDNYPKDQSKELPEVFSDYKDFKRKEVALSDAIFDAQEAGELPGTDFPETDADGVPQNDEPAAGNAASKKAGTDPKTTPDQSKDYRKGSDTDRNNRGPRARAPRGNGSAKTAAPQGAPKQSAYGPRSKNEDIIDAEEVPTPPENSSDQDAPTQPLPKAQAKKFSDRVKNVFKSVADSPRKLTALNAFRAYGEDAQVYAAKRERRTMLIRGAIGAAVIAKVAIDGVLVAKGLSSGGFGTSFADALPTNHGGGFQSFADTVTNHQGSGSQEAADLMQHTESLKAGDNIWEHASAIAAHHGITDPHDPRIAEATNRIVSANGLSTYDTTHMAVGQKFEVPDLSDIFGKQPAAAGTEHVGFTGDTYWRHATDQLHQEGIANPDAHTGPVHAAAQVAPDMSPLGAAHHAEPLPAEIPRAEIIDAGGTMAAGIGAIAAHETLERIMQEMRDNDMKAREEDEDAEDGLWKKKKPARAGRPQPRGNRTARGPATKRTGRRTG